MSKKKAKATESETQTEAPAEAVADEDTEEEMPEETVEETPLADRAENGPFDESEANPIRPYIDLGGIKILPREGLNLRLEVEEQTKRIVAVGLDYADSTLQVQPFAAPRSSGLWEETRAQIQEQVAQQGGRVSEHEGALGVELLAEIPTASADGGATRRLARFVGVDGPRWFLRGVIGGAATSDPEAAAAVEDLFRSLVVVRGGSPMPPRDLIPLRMPGQAA